MGTDIISFKRNLGAMIERGDLTLPSTVDVDAFRNAAIVAFQTNPNIRKGTPESVFTALRHIAGQGLMPDGREAAIVVYGDKAQAQSMVAGLRKIVRNSGQVVSMWDDVVYEGEDIVLRIEDGIRVWDHVNEDGTPLKAMKRGGRIIGAYAAAKLKDGTSEVEVMTTDQIEKRRKASPNQKGPKATGIWADWFDEMARKTVVRALCKRLPMSSEDYQRIEADPGFRQLDMKDVTPQETTAERLKRLSGEADAKEKEDAPRAVAEEPESVTDEPTEEDQAALDGEIMPEPEDIGDVGDAPEYDDNAVFPGDAIFSEGVNAFKAKKSIGDNPYPANPNYSNWRAGWEQAREFAAEGIK